MAHGFSDDKEIADLDAAITAAVRPIYSIISTLQNAVGNYWKTIYPVGSIYISTSQTNPGSIFGGTWEQFAAGRTLVGVDPMQSEFNQVQKTGGSKTQDIRIDYMHKHEINVPDAAGNISPHIYKNYTFNSSSARRNYVLGVDIPASAQQVEAGKLQDIPVSAVGNMWETATGGNTQQATQTVNKLQPYVTVYFWRRTA